MEAQVNPVRTFDSTAFAVNLCVKETASETVA